MSLRQKGLYLTLSLAVIALATAFASQVHAGAAGSRHMFGAKAAPAVEMQYQHHSGPGGCPFEDDGSDL
jgi:hypothetical protein